MTISLAFRPRDARAAPTLATSYVLFLKRFIQIFRCPSRCYLSSLHFAFRKEAEHGSDLLPLLNY